MDTFLEQIFCVLKEFTFYSLLSCCIITHWYHTLIKPAVVCFCVAVLHSVNMHLPEMKQLYFMKTELSDLCAEVFFSEEVLLPQKIPLPVFVIFSSSGVRPSPSCWSEVPTVPNSAAPGCSTKMFHRKMIKESPRSAQPLLLSPAKILHWEHAYPQNESLDF